MKKIGLLLLLGACTHETKTTTQEKKYFDLDGFIQKKIIQLTNKQTLVEKNVAINGKEERINNTKVDWSKELSLFKDADLNKQAYLTSYTKTETPNLLIYTLKAGEELPVQSLKITLDSLGKTPKQIEARLQTKNYLYESDKDLLLLLQKGDVQSYRIESSQKLFWGDKKNFKIEGKVLN